MTVRYSGRKIDELIVKRPVLTIGRKADNDIRLEDTTVSTHHAKLQALPDGIYIEDTDSTNGTYVNGERVTSRLRLFDGDVVVIGKYTITHEVIDYEPPSLELDPTLQIGRQELQQILARLENAPLSESSGIFSVSKKTLNWIAQDESGVWWGFENKPVPGIHGWIDGLDGTKVLLKQENRTNPDWRETLQKL